MNKILDRSRNEGESPRAVSSSRLIPSAEWLVVALMAAYLTVHTLPSAWKTLNTDFPNYYLTARLAQEKSSTSRIYEWVWLQRQKDHREIDQRIIALIPITPFSTLAVRPFAAMQPLAAKRCWLVLNLLLVASSVMLIRSLTGLAWRRVMLLVALSIPLNKNLLFGQYYVLLLFVLTLACWCYLRERRFLSGLLIGVSFGLKIFPVLYLGYFLRKRDLKAFAGGIIGGAGAAILSVAVFGWQANRVLVSQVLPWTLRGETLDPYNLSSASIATLLHRLFVFEPQWNPNPSFHLPWMLAVVLPLAQTLLFAPALLLAEPSNTSPRRLHLEWSAVLLGSLAISTLPAGYHFTLLILPACLMWNEVYERGGLRATAGLLFLFTAIGYPGWKSIGTASPLTLLSVPRLYAVILLCFFVYWLLVVQGANKDRPRDTLIWGGAFALVMCLNIASGLRHQSGLYADYQWRIPTGENILQTNGPVMQDGRILFTAMVPTGYRTVAQDQNGFKFDVGDVDQLGVTANSTGRWTEEVGKVSTIVSSVPGKESIHQAENPVASPNGRWLAYLREEHGRGRIWLRSLDQANGKDNGLTPGELDVLEMSFLPNGSLVFSAESSGRPPRLYLVDEAGVLISMGTDEARYPAASGDGRWLAYSKLQNGNWHLWLRDLHDGQTRRLTQADCNNVQPTWTSDSKTLVYASDCGRALWFTALCRRRIIE